MSPEAPELGGIRARCGECQAWDPFHASHCARYVPEKHTASRNLFWLETAKAVGIAVASRRPEGMTAGDMADYAARFADKLLAEAVGQDRL